jgi:branched-chain amino acid transport system substrate-binding protein
MLNGALLGVDECNAAFEGSVELRPVILDPGGRLSAYADHCETLIRDYGCRHIIGCYTSAARKQVLPILERTNTLLWHSARYEGFEASENVMYIGAAPNQHIVPLARYVLETLEPEIYCVGSNYIWTWETNRVLRDLVVGAGGRIVAQRLVPLGETDLDHIVAEILERRPKAVFNTLVGESSYRFFRAFWRALSSAPNISPSDIPILSCSLCEPELHLIGEPASVGHVTSAVYFQSVDRPENRSFLERYRARFGAHASPSVDAEAAYVCAMLLGRALAAAGTDAVEPVRRAAFADAFEAPQGPVRLDPETNHAFLTPRLAVSRRGYEFEIFWEAREPIKPDPYLAWLDELKPSSAGRTPAGSLPESADSVLKLVP